jgi:hypothetical protein
VLYSGFCGAILFGKVLRIQSHAQVTFSDPIVIRYGPGLKESSGDRGGRDASNGDGGPENGHDTEAVAEKMPCPVLEFRIVNRLYGEAGGEIMDGEDKPTALCHVTALHVSFYCAHLETHPHLFCFCSCSCVP